VGGGGREGGREGEDQRGSCRRRSDLRSVDGVCREGESGPDVVLDRRRERQVQSKGRVEAEGGGEGCTEEEREARERHYCGGGQWARRNCWKMFRV